MTVVVRDAQRLLRRRRPELAARLTWEIKRRRGDHSLALLERLVRRGDHVVDAGANWGLFTAALAELTGVEGRVSAFEPHPTHARTLGAIAARHPWVEVHIAALSERPGSAELTVPVHAGRELSALASLTPHADWEVRRLRVPVTTLDAALADGPPVRFVKCDVEGHELEVLRGGERILRRDRPVLLLEVEQRHRPAGCVDEVLDHVLGLAYRGWCVRRHGLAPLDGFDVERDQMAFVRELGFVAHEMPPDYVNTFLFEPRR